VEIEDISTKIASLDNDLVQIQNRIDKRHEQGEHDADTLPEAGAKRLPEESQREFLIRTGKITPFSTIGGVTRSSSNLDGAILELEEEIDAGAEPATGEKESLSHQNLRLPGFSDEWGSESSTTPDVPDRRPVKRRRLQKTPVEPRSRAEVGDSNLPESEIESDDVFTPDSGDEGLLVPEEEDESEGDKSDYLETRVRSKREAKRKGKKTKVVEGQKEDFSGLDDGDEKVYQARLLSWVKRRSEARRKKACLNLEGFRRGAEIGSDMIEAGGPETRQTDLPEWLMPHPTKPDEVLGDGYRIPGDIYPALFGYQKVGVQWLRELHTQRVGGIIGDEMGLGKTIQVISFLAGLHYSKMLTKPVIVVAPATVLKQWVNEFHRWWPPLRVSILHTSGSGMLNVRGEARIEEEEDICGTTKIRPTKARKSAEKIIKRVVDLGHVLVTTYAGLKTYGDLLIPVDWECAVLDEGHKIRNPNAEVTIYCKELRTANRIILSGTPMQNNLTELWSLFDFVFPMRLGTLVNFRNQFEIPIKLGGYANANNLQVETAMKCAEILKDTISAYLLQRLKVDVAADLPRKSEQVLFCKLTKLQERSYESFLGSDELKSILNGRRQALYGIDVLRKICNHPDLVDREVLKKKAGYKYGSGSKSGKMQVVKALLGMFKQFGHKALLFCQTRIMLDIIENYIKDLGGFNYRRMDGTTNIKDRQNLVDEFNNTDDIHVFLLTTKVGGLGVNLTGANRVIIFDPDWNPSTDVQARERAWRLGQKKEVTIFRLLTSGTIEEKIYHRQIFKQFLTNKILRDPKQRQTFQMKDLHDLFTLGSTEGGQTETGQMFKGTEVQYDKGIPSGQGENASSDSTAPIKLLDVEGVANVEDYQEGEEEEGGGGGEGEKKSLEAGHEARIMEGIFANSGVHSALEHDQIINGKKVQADPKIIEREAKKVAAEAARELKKAGEEARKVPVGTPTWTGQFGVAGRPTDQRGGGRSGPSSAGILANLQSRQSAAQNASSNSSRASTPNPTSYGGNRRALTGKDFMKQIRDFLLAHGGQVRSQMLVDHFNWQCTTPQRTAQFTAMLRELAVKDDTGARRGRAVWKLKDDYMR
jgi:DNA excision repair protein ERCC-6